MATASVLSALKYFIMMAVLHESLAHGKSPPTQSAKNLGQMQQLCPTACICYSNTVDCNSMQLSQVPTGLPTRTKVLILNYNVIETLNFVHLRTLKELEEVHVRGNQLKGLQSDGVSLLPKLRVVDLRDNPVVCDCDLAWVAVNRTLGPSRVEFKVGETRCASPERHVGERVADALVRRGCRNRAKRFTEKECSPDYCLNGGTCVVEDEMRMCICPSTHTGLTCDRPITSNVLYIFLDDITSDSIHVSWKIRDSRTSKFMVSIMYLPVDDRSYNIWTTHNEYTFTQLWPGGQYKVCVTAVTDSRETIASECEVYQTHMPPSLPGTDPFHPSPEGHLPNPDRENHYHNDDTVHKAAVILGSIIGVCAFFIICLTMVYKFRPSRNPRVQENRSSSPALPQTDPESPQEEVGVSNPGHEIIVLSMSSANNPAGTPPEAAEAAGHELVADTTLTISDPDAISTVLQALKQQGYCAPQDAGTSTTPPMNTRLQIDAPVVDDQGSASASSQGIPAGTTPIFLVADGNHYPLDPTLSEALRSAMSRPNGPVPNEPPPPYTERADNPPPTPPTADHHEATGTPVEHSGCDNINSAHVQDSRL